MTLDLSDHRDYVCRNCRHRTINHEDAEETQQRLCTACLSLDVLTMEPVR